VTSDEEGLFRLDLPGPLPVGRHPVKATLHDDERRFRVAPASLQVFAAKPGVAVISDIDDTVLDSQVRSKRKLVWKVLTSNARKLKTFAGAPELYRALAKKGYPIVFVSGSPINLYTRLRRFFGLRGFPAAPLMLKNLGRGEGSDSLLEQQAYKLKRIDEVAALLPGYRLILIGDSGEKDPEIYARAAKKRPKQVKAILIHDVTGEKQSASRFRGQLLFKRYARAAGQLRKQALLD
jgi:phosphatidate phosphatase APP1